LGFQALFVSGPPPAPKPTQLTKPNKPISTSHQPTTNRPNPTNQTHQIKTQPTKPKKPKLTNQINPTLFVSGPPPAPKPTQLTKPNKPISTSHQPTTNHPNPTNQSQQINLNLPLTNHKPPKLDKSNPPN
jgi:hypothetical protein